MTLYSRFISSLNPRSTYLLQCFFFFLEKKKENKQVSPVEVSGKEICAQGSRGIWRDHFWPAEKHQGLSYRDGVNRHLTSQRRPPPRPCSKGYADVWKWLGSSVSANLAKYLTPRNARTLATEPAKAGMFLDLLLTTQIRSDPALRAGSLGTQMRTNHTYGYDGGWNRDSKTLTWYNLTRNSKRQGGRPEGV